jgi:excisionase family DNA binding protein
MEAKNGMMTLSDAARYLGIRRQTLYNWIKAGKLYPVRIMGLPYLPVTELDKIKAKK